MQDCESLTYSARKHEDSPNDSARKHGSTSAQPWKSILLKGNKQDLIIEKRRYSVKSKCCKLQCYCK